MSIMVDVPSGARDLPVTHVPAWRRVWPLYAQTAAIVAVLVAPSFTGGQRLAAAVVGTGAAFVGCWLIPIMRRDAELIRAQHGPATVVRRVSLVEPSPYVTEVLPVVLVTLAAVQVVAGFHLLAVALGLVLAAAGAYSVWRRTSPVAIGREVERIRERQRRADAERVRTTWARTVASETWGGRGARKSGGPLVGSKLRAVKVRDGGWEGTVTLPGGQSSLEDVVRARPAIAKAYGVSRDLVHVTPTRTEGTVRVVLFTRDPLQAVEPWRAPSLNRSWAVTFGRRADGSEISYQLVDSTNSPAHALVAGVTGSGKSSPFQVLAAEAMASGRALVFIADPDGESIKGAASRVDGYADTLEGCLDLVEAVQALMTARMRRKALNRRPSRSHPLVVLLVDEAPTILADKRGKAAVSELVRRGRKAGVLVAMACQQPSAEELGATIRSQAMGGLVFVFRASDKATGSMTIKDKLPGVEPETIPRKFDNGQPTVGVGFTPGDDGSTLPFRARFLDEAGWRALDEITAKRPNVTPHERDLEALGEWAPRVTRAGDVGASTREGDFRQGVGQ